MKYYLAPLEGYTGFTVRNAIEKFFPGMDKYFTPFLPMSQKLGAKYIRDILPENNHVKELVPQIMATNIDEVNHLYNLVKDYGYKTLNINLGCPSGTVVSKNRGAGFLRDTDELDRFLYDISEKAPCSISIKTRIGFYDLNEWEDILNVYKKYSFEELIIHPRIQKELYKGVPHIDAFKMAYEVIDKSPLIYNGDVRCVEDINRITSEFPNISGIMIGRGMFINPDILFEYNNGHYPADYRDRLVEFHDYIYDEYMELFSGEADVLMHMKGIWAYMVLGFKDAEKILKKIRKTKHASEYKALAHEILLHNEFS